MSHAIFDRLVAIADANPHLLTAYRNDLHGHDKVELTGAARSDRYIWILREHGTELFPVGYGLDPVWATYWLESRTYIVAPLAYEVDLKAGTVAQITYDRARELASIPHPCGRQIKISLFSEAA